MLFLRLCYLVNKAATKAATPRCVPQDIVRARYTPHKRYFIMFVRGHTVLFLCLCDLVNKDPPRRLLRLFVFL